MGDQEKKQELENNLEQSEKNQGVLKKKNEKDLKYRPIRFVILFSILSMILPILLIFSAIDLFSARADLNKSFNQLKKKSADNIISSMTIVDNAYKMLDSSLDKKLQDGFKVFIDAYEDAGNNPDNMDLEALKEKLGGNTDLYIIDDGVITYTTYPKDLGLDFKQWPDFFKTLEDMRVGPLKYYGDRLTMEIRTGQMRKFAYHPSPDNRYILELGLVSEEFQEYMGEMRFSKLAKNLVSEDPVLDDLRIYKESGIGADADYEAEDWEKKYIDKVAYSDEVLKTKNPESGKEIHYHFIYFKDEKYASDVGYIIRLTYNNKQIQTALLKRTIFSIILIIITVGLTIFIAVYISGKIAHPVNLLKEKVKTISEGEGDLTQKIEIVTNDEISVLSNYFNKFLDTLKSLIHSTKESVSSSADIGKDLSNSSEKGLQSISYVNSKIDLIENQYEILNMNISESGDSTRHVVESIDSLRKDIDEQAAAVEESSQAIKSLISSLNKVSEMVEEKQQRTEALMAKTKEGGEKVRKTNSIIESISGDVEKILEMIDMINSISDTTNILAMNASIQASHAGEAGKGFMVVASEVRGLAESTLNNAENMEYSLTEMIKKIQESLESSKQSGLAFKEISTEVESVTHSFGQVTASMSEMSGNSEEVLGEIEKVLNITENVKSSYNEMYDNANKTGESMGRIQETSDVVLENIKKILDSVNDMKTLNEKLASMGNQNKTNLENLKNKLDRFITE